MAERYGVFSFAKSQRNVVIKYIMNQEIHHQQKSFRDEYIKMLTDFDVAYQDKYLFEFYDWITDSFFYVYKLNSVIITTKRKVGLLTDYFIVNFLKFRPNGAIFYIKAIVSFHLCRNKPN